MKIKVLFLVTIIGLMSFVANAQRGVRIGYIDTEYILQNVPEYQEASSQLDNKVLKWKAEIEQRLSAIEQKKNQLNSESVLLTKELYEERLEDINYEELEILDYQQKRFGPNGDLMVQKQQLIQPIQDQIFAAVQEIAKNRKYDFIFDKSADVVMLYSAQRFDISEMVIRSITRASKRTQAQTKAQRKAAEKEDIVPVINPELEARQKELEAKKAEQAATVEAKKAKQIEEREARKKAAEERRQKILDDRAKAKAKRDSLRNAKTPGKGPTKTTALTAEEKKQQKLKEREARKKELEARKKKILEEREKAKKEREAQEKQKDSVPNDNN